MSLIQREWTFTATASWQLIFEIPSGHKWKHCMVDNFGAVELEVAFCTTEFADFTVPGKTSKAVDDDLFMGRVYVRRTSGLLNTVGRIRLW